MRITPRINDQRERDDGSCAIRIEIRHNGRERHPMNINVKPGLWDEKRGRVRIGHPKHALYNAKIKEAVDRIEGLCLDNPTSTAKEIRTMLKRPSGGGNLATAIAQVGRSEGVNKETVRINNLVVANVEAALPDVLLQDFTATHARELRKHLEAEGLHQNTVRLRMLRLRSLINAATGKVTDAFKKVVPSELESSTGSLTPEEVRAFRMARMPTKSVELARDAWMLQLTLAGMRVGDVLSVGPQHIAGDLLVHTQIKTNLVRRVPIIAQARVIMERYAGGKTFLPIVGFACADLHSGRTMLNTHLKVAALAAGIDKPLATHWARHTFANWMAELDVREDVIAILMGHRAKTRTASYMAKQGDERSRKAMALLEAALG
jgi:integrase